MSGMGIDWIKLRPQWYLTALNSISPNILSAIKIDISIFKSYLICELMTKIRTYMNLGSELLSCAGGWFADLPVSYISLLFVCFTNSVFYYYNKKKYII